MEKNKEKILAEYIELNKRLVLEKIKANFNINSGLTEIKKQLDSFEKNNLQIIKDFYLYKLRHNHKSYWYWIVLFHFFRRLDPLFESEIISQIFDNNDKKFKLTIRNMHTAVDLFYKGKKAISIKQNIEKDLKLKDMFERYSDEVIIKKDLRKQILINDDSVFDFSKFTEIKYPDVDFSKVILKDELKTKILSIIHKYRYLKSLIKEGNFEKEIRGTAPVILLRGFPGTGKTLTAYAITNALKLPLVKLKFLRDLYDEGYTFVDLIKNLNKKECIILLDEFDLLIRNRDITLPDLFEAFEISKNMLILTSNQLEIEEELLPLLRRITYNIVFKIPDKELRKKLWEFHLPKEYRFADNIDIDELAGFYILTGGNIKNILVNYVLLYNKTKVIEKERLIKLINDELDKNDYSVNYLLQIESGYHLKESDIKIKRMKSLVNLIEHIDKITKMKNDRVFIGIYSEYPITEFAQALSFYLKKPVVIESGLDDDLFDSKFMRRREEKYRMKEYLFNLLEKDDFFALSKIPYIRNIEDKTDEILVRFFLNEKAKELNNNNLFCYTNYWNFFHNAKYIFDYVFMFHKYRWNIRKNIRAPQIDISKLKKIKFEKGFDIHKFILDIFSVQYYNYIPSFINHLLIHYILKDNTTITKAEVIKIFKKLVPRKTSPLLFGI